MEKVEEQQDKTIEPKPVVDAFGQPRNTDGSLRAPETPKQEPETPEPPKKVDVLDLDTHPVVEELRKQLSGLEERNSQLEQDKSNMGKNLSGQREKMDKIKAALKEAEGELPFPTIRRTKDLKKEELEQMTETEKHLMDTVADMQEANNKQFLANRKKEIEAEINASESTQQEDAVTKFHNTVQGEALKLAGNDKALASQIIENFNLFKENDKLTGKALTERLVKAAAMTEGYKPPKEQKPQRGGAVAGPSNADDPFGIKQIVQDVQKKGSGNYDL